MADAELGTLFQELRDGDQNAFAQLYETLKKPVFTICWRIVQSKEMAEDLTHDVFIKLYTSPPDSSVRNGRAYVFQMARNLSIDTLRKRRDVQMEDEILPVDSGMEQLDKKLDLERAMASLSEDEREILTLHLNADLTFKQIGSVVGLSLPAVYRKYRKAIAALRDLLNGGAQ